MVYVWFGTGCLCLDLDFVDYLRFNLFWVAILIIIVLGFVFFCFEVFVGIPFVLFTLWLGVVFSALWLPFWFGFVGLVLEAWGGCVAVRFELELL